MYSSSQIIIGTENPAVDALLKAAFGRNEEALLVSRLRSSNAFIPALSLVEYAPEFGI